MTSTQKPQPSDYGRTAREALRDLVTECPPRPATIDQIRDTIRTAEELLSVAVHEYRATGASWAEIGRVFGISRQSAWERFGDLDPQAPIQPR